MSRSSSARSPDFWPGTLTFSQPLLDRWLLTNIRTHFYRVSNPQIKFYRPRLWSFFDDTQPPLTPRSRLVTSSAHRDSTSPLLRRCLKSAGISVSTQGSSGTFSLLGMLRLDDLEIPRWTGLLQGARRLLPARLSFEDDPQQRLETQRYHLQRFLMGQALQQGLQADQHALDIFTLAETRPLPLLAIALRHQANGVMDALLEHGAPLDWQLTSASRIASSPQNEDDPYPDGSSMFHLWALHDASYDVGPPSALNVSLQSLLSAERAQGQPSRLNAFDAQGRTALHVAAHFGHVDHVLALLQAGADPNLSVQPSMNPSDGWVEGDTILHHAKQPDIALALLDAGVDPNRLNARGESAADRLRCLQSTKITTPISRLLEQTRILLERLMLQGVTLDLARSPFRASARL